LGVDDSKGGWPDLYGNQLRCYHASLPSAARPTAISLFSGAGGLDIGFHDAGFQILECNEIEEAFAETLRKNTGFQQRLEGTNVICKDINEYNPNVKNVDFLIGGPPCQTFSAAGARAAGVNGVDDDRGKLFLQYARIIDRLQPRGFLFENVYRIVGAQSGKPWKMIQAAFQELGYKLHWRILDAADYGVPQFRERLIIVGLKEGTFEFPFPSHGPDSGDNRNYYTAKQAVDGINTSNCKIGIGGRHGHLLNEIPPGLNYSYYTERMGHPKPLFGWRSKFSDYLYKADPDSPVRTIKAQGGQYTGPFSWENRPFSTEELKRLQTFPDDYVITGNRQVATHQIGNSVPPQLARVLALSILQQAFQTPLPFNIRLMPDSHRLGFRKRKSMLTDVYSSKAAHGIAQTKPEIAKRSTNAKGNHPISVGADLKLHVDVDKIHAEYTASFNLSNQSWRIEIHEQNKASDTARFEILIASPWPTERIGSLPKEGVLLVSRSNHERSLLAVWKMFEFLIQKHLSKDDLVQLFGYYQYKQAYSFKMNVYDNSLACQPLWRVAKLVTLGVGVGRIISAEELCYLFEVTEADLILSLRSLKSVGYEIRSKSTNKQIQKNMFLIPYSFPTLNERSLQRLTRI
jgi:DNA (cytosine-5)-methyltransferase 1